MDGQNGQLCGCEVVWDGQNGQLCGCKVVWMVRMASCVVVRLCGWSEWPVVWLCGVWDGQNGQLCGCEVCGWSEWPVVWL